jgi:hypothetical protein
VELGAWVRVLWVQTPSRQNMTPSEYRSLTSGPVVTSDHDTCFQQVHNEVHEVRSTNKDWDFVSKDTELSVGHRWFDWNF